MKSKDIAVFGILAALTAVFALLPFVFLLPLLVGSIRLGAKKAFFLSLLFGVISLAYSFMLPTSFVGLAFMENPWLPIVARLPIGSCVALLFSGLRKKNAPLAVISSSVLGCVVNTACVLLCMLLIASRLDGLNGQSLQIVLPTLFINFAIEVAAAAALVFPIIKALDKLLREDFGKTPPKISTKPVAVAASASVQPLQTADDNTADDITADDNTADDNADN